MLFEQRSGSDRTQQLMEHSGCGRSWHRCCHPGSESEHLGGQLGHDTGLQSQEEVVGWGKVAQAYTSHESRTRGSLDRIGGPLGCILRNSQG